MRNVFDKAGGRCWLELSLGDGLEIVAAHDEAE